MNPSSRDEYSTATPSISSPRFPRKSPESCAVDSFLCPLRAFEIDSFFALGFDVLSALQTRDFVNQVVMVLNIRHC